MGKAYAWHPGSGCVNSKLTVSLDLLPDEILSSWLIRLALVHGCNPLSFTDTIWPKWRVWTVDTDRTIPQERLDKLSALTGVSSRQIAASSIAPIAQKIREGQLQSKAYWPWILTQGSRNLKRNKGIQYCPYCLVEDFKPYFRLQWRFAWHTVCDKHGCILLDTCLKCRMPLEPHRLTASDKMLIYCAICNEDIRGFMSQPCHQDSLDFQLETDRVLKCNSGAFFGEPLTTFEWFDLSKFFVSIIRRNYGLKPARLGQFLDLMHVTTPQQLPIEPGSSIEYLNTISRYDLFKAILKLLLATKDQFKTSLLESGISQQGVRGDNKTIPDKLNELIRDLPSKAINRQKIIKQKSTHIRQPIPHDQVSRMFQRLQAKLSLKTQ